ncbi:hypothetical protein PL81_31590 [Streptomyces sp. RSD-27]|nr:hypothetical protein PL81_31590 [Streptomyces sp. RSD-27]
MRVVSLLGRLVQQPQGIVKGAPSRSITRMDAAPSRAARSAMRDEASAREAASTRARCVRDRGPRSKAECDRGLIRRYSIITPIQRRWRER